MQQKGSTSAKLNSEVRIDLINEINDEFLEEDALSMGSNKLLATNANNPNNISLDDEDDDFQDRKMYLGGGDSVGGMEGGLGGMSSDDEEVGGGNSNSNADNDSTSSNFNLANLRVSIDGLDEVNEAGSSRTVYVFVIHVWNLDPKLMEKKATGGAGGETPNWFVKRKYDEFYVLDSRLRQFHGGGLMNTPTSAASANTGSSSQVTRGQITVAQLPPKPRAILSFSNKENNLEYLESIQNDFERYLQVN